MQTPALTLLFMILSSLLVGGAIGYGFGADWEKGRPVAPRPRPGSGGGHGSLGKAVALVAALVAVQVICPLLFTTATTKWWVIAGIGTAYGWQRFRRLRALRAPGR